MCGIAAIFAYDRSAARVEQMELLKIREAMINRGPDGAGAWISPDKAVGLAHRRLAIIDLTDKGLQPMATADGRLRITFNGEIYNYRELRKELESKGFRFRSSSDTEVLLHLYADKGADMVSCLRGMYAFAIWDEPNQRLFLARDPFGIKPLYYSDDGGTIRVASQVKALLRGGSIAAKPDPAGHVGFFLWGHVPEPFTLYKAIRSLPAGMTLSIDSNGRSDFGHYFDLTNELRLAADSARPVSRAEAQEQIRAALLDSVRHHLIADVPVGVFLSSGLDSTTLTALATELGGSALHTITLGFKEFQGTPNDEVPLAEKIARHYGADHQTHWVAKDDFWEEQQSLLQAMDQPSIDGVNSYFVSKAAAKSGLKVALSGTGGDELFGGYSSFWQVPLLTKLARPLGAIPGLNREIRRILAPVTRKVASAKYAGLLEYGVTHGGAYLLRRALYMPWEIPDLLGDEFVREGLGELQTLPRLAKTTERLESGYLKVAALEAAWYMRNQLLRDADWASMAHSLEVRVPLVDIKLYRAVIPLLASRQKTDKLMMAAAPARPLPNEVLVRRKTGFSVPVQFWLTQRSRSLEGGLKGWAKVVCPLPRPLSVVLIYRERRKGRHSIEGLFDGIAQELSKKANVAKYELGSRWRVLVDAYRLRSLRADVYHITGDVHYVALLLPRDKTLLTVHDIHHYLSNLHGVRRWLYKWIWLIWPIRHARVVVAISEETRRNLAGHLPIGDRQIQVIPDCVSPNFRAVPKPFNEERPVVLQVGTGPNKNLNRVAKALQGSECRLSIIGPLSAVVRRELKQLEVPYEHGHNLAEEEVVNRYEQTDVVCFVSLYEGFGLPIIEAQAVGRALVTSDLEPMRTVAGDGACLVDPYSVSAIRAALRRIVDDSEYRSRLVESGFANVRRYRQDAIASQYHGIYVGMRQGGVEVAENELRGAAQR